MGYQILGVVLGLIGLTGVYRLIETSWPANYFSLSDYASYRQTIHPAAYLLFRFAPVFLVALFLAVSLDRGDQPVWPASLVMLVAYAALTHGRAAASVWPNKRDPRRSPLVALHLIGAVGVILIGVAATALRTGLDALVPSLDSLAGELWGAVIAGAFGAYLVTRTRTTSHDERSLVSRARRRIPAQLVELARTEAVRNEAHPDLVEALLITEDVQRPRWFRALERVKSVAFPDGTYGIMQVRHHGWVSDIESIRIATAGPLAGQQIPIETSSGGYRSIDVAALRDQLSHYNRSSTWLEMFTSILISIHPVD